MAPGSDLGDVQYEAGGAHVVPSSQPGVPLGEAGHYAAVNRVYCDDILI
jgi:hypothetical protein